MAEGSGVSTMTLGSLVSKEAVLVPSPNTGDSRASRVGRGCTLGVQVQLRCLWDVPAAGHGLELVRKSGLDI